MMDLSCLERADRPFEAKDLLDALPLFGEPLVQIRTTHASFGAPAARVLCPRSLPPAILDGQESGRRKRSAISSLSVGWLSLAMST